MKNIILVFILLLSPIPVMAAVSLCSNIEYAELKDMNKEDLANENCQVKKLIKMEFAKTPILNFSQHMKNLDGCMDMEKRIERVFKSRKETLPVCPE